MQQRQQQQKQQLRQPHTGTTYRGRRAEKWQWTVELLNSMMHQRVSEKTSGEWEGCVIWREGLLQRLRVCVCVYFFLSVCFRWTVFDGDWIYSFSETITSLPLDFFSSIRWVVLSMLSPEAPHTCSESKDMISPIVIKTSDSFRQLHCFLQFVCIAHFQFRDLDMPFLIPNPLWCYCRSLLIPCVFEQRLQQRRMIIGANPCTTWQMSSTMPLHLTLGEQNGHGWICMKMEGSGYKQSLVCAKNSPCAMWVYPCLRPWLPFVVQQPGRQLCSSWKATDWKTSPPQDDASYVFGI